MPNFGKEKTHNVAGKIESPEPEVYVSFCILFTLYDCLLKLFCVYTVLMAALDFARMVTNALLLIIYVRRVLEPVWPIKK